MNKDKSYIVLFDDGSLQIYNMKPDKKNFQEDARFFEVASTISIDIIGDWIGQRYRHNRFEEV